MKNYLSQIKNIQSPTFQEIKNIAKNSISHLSKKDRNELWEKLKRGTELLGSHELMCQYLYSFGDMHEAKIRDAVNHLPDQILQSNFEIVDWGCGQGIGTVCFFDYLKNKQFDNNAKNITLIEPSKEALKRAELHVSTYFTDDVKINTYQKFLDDVSIEDIQSKNNLPVIHFFSNILDIKEINLKVLAAKIDETVTNDNYIVSVGPLNFGNKRIDAFYKYFQVPLIYDIEDSQFPINQYNTKTYKAKIYKLEFNKNGNLIPIEFYPSVQFHSSYQLDSVNYEYENNDKLKLISTKLNIFDISTPFDIGASVYDDIEPILAVLNNIIVRGLPTKASLFIEEIFQNTFKCSERNITYGTISYPSIKNIEYNKILNWYNSIITKEKKLDFSKVNTEYLQIIFSPIAIVRVQKTILEALMTEKLDINSVKWKILIDEKDVPCSVIAFEDLTQMFNNLTKLSRDYKDLIFPQIELDIISNNIFAKSKLHLNNKVSEKIIPRHLQTEYDLVIDISIFQTSNIKKESFSKFHCKNDCYFNVRSANEIRSERNIYTTDRIVYQDLVSNDGKGNYEEINETKKLLEYFLQLIFRKESFRAGQLPILNRALQKKSLIGLLPTGGGKSLTYQLAAILQPGITLIVDPLRSLMKDQYDGLINAGIDTCAYINSTLSKDDKKEAERKMEESKLQFVFLSPERLTIYKFRKKLENMHELNVYFSYGVIDEVHCVSEWGHDFRFSYLHLGKILYSYVRAKEGEVSLFGLTATASFDVLADVERELSGNNAYELDAETIVRYENSNRLELQYKIEKVNVEFENDPNYDKNNYLDSWLPRAVQVSKKWSFYDSKKDFLKNYVKTIPRYINEIQSIESINDIKKSFKERQGNNEGIESNLETKISNNYYSKKTEYEQAGIVFCPHKNSTGISVYKNNESLISEIPDVGTFSGGDEEDNNSMQNLELFRTNKQPLMVATKAFGMGIDKPNVRFTINMNYSSSLESFVQEAGRGGRDRKMALSVILLSDYKLARISRKFQNGNFPLGIIKGRWFRFDDLQQIINHYNLNIDKQYIDYLTPENDLVRLFCKDGNGAKYFGFNSCNDMSCRFLSRCQLKRVPREAENWIYKDDLSEILKNNSIIIDKKYIEYQNADYETVMYFYNNSFKGEMIEKLSMYQILSVKDIDMFYGNEVEIKSNETSTVKGFLTTLIDSEVGQNIVSFINYKTQNTINGIDVDETDIAKAIYRMTCIELIEDFTQDYTKNQYRIVSERKKEGQYYEGLERFLLRYYSFDRAKEEIKKVFDVKLNKEVKSELEKEIFQCLSYLTTFVYDKISVKRKRAIDDMRTFCITGINNNKDWKETNEELKDFIYYYFNSKYAKNDYIADNGEDYSITVDTDNGKNSEEWILFKYLKVIDDEIEQGTPIDNVKHLQGAVRLLRRSLTDSNPTLSLLNSFSIFFLGINNNENLEKEVIESYKDGMLGFAEREKNLSNFWKIFNSYNLILKPFSDNRLEELRDEITLKIHQNKFNNITLKYIKE